MSTRGFGWKKDQHDSRDLGIARLGLGVNVPASASLRQHVSEVLDQGSTSSCVAHAWAQALRISDEIDGAASPELSSREFLYYNARAFDGETGIDGGTYLRSCARGVVKFGRPPESAWPFELSTLNVRPSWEAYRAAADFEGDHGYYRIAAGDFASIRSALAAGKPVVFGTDAVPQSFVDYAGGVYDLTGEPSLGGHALCLVGYDTAAGWFELANSWGIGWGEGGFARVSPAWLAKADDLWAVDVQGAA